MTKSEKVSIATSIGALIISCLAFVVSIRATDEASLYVYEGEYDVTNEFSATFKIALLNSGDFDVVASDLWLTVGQDCDIAADDRIRAREFENLVTNQINRTAAGRFEFRSGKPMQEGKHRICLLVEVVSSRGFTQGYIAGEDELKVLDIRGVKDIIDRNPERWKRTLLLYSERVLQW